MKSHFSEKFGKKVKKHLENDEQYIIGVRVNLPGLVAAMSMRATGGTVGFVLAAQKHKKEKQKAENSLQQSSPQMALALTNKRILIFKRSVLTGGVREFIGHIDRSAIKKGEVEKKLFGYDLMIYLNNEKKLELQGIGMDHCKEFITEINR